MNSEQLEAARNLIEYIKESEQKHWEESDKDPSHIYADALILEGYLDGTEVSFG